MPVVLLPYLFVCIQLLLLLLLTFLGIHTSDLVFISLLFFPAMIANSWYIGAPAGYLTALVGAFVLGIDSYFPAIIFFLEGIAVSYFLHYHCKDQKAGQYKQKEKELRARIEELERENVRAKEDIRLRDEFLSIASHELKTPLTSMLLHIQTALHNIRTVSLADFSIEKLMQMLQRTQNQTKRLSKMINDLLNVSLITTGRLNLERESIDLAEVVREVVASFAERAQKEGYEIELKTEPVQGEWDSFRIEQAMINLISNAIKYGNRKPITVQVSRHNGIAQAIVTDHGIGIPVEKQQQIFHLFERGVSAEAYKGLGVGLYITRQIVTAHGGTIAVSSSPGKGSTFTIELPVRSS